MVTKILAKVIITKCSMHSYWYARLTQKIDNDSEENIKSRTFDVEMCEDRLFRTIEDVAGPGVRGFIDVMDCMVVDANEEFTEYLNAPHKHKWEDEKS